MANQITDNRTLVVNGDSVTNWVASSSAALDTEIFITGTGSIAENMTNAVRYIMFNTGATQNWSNNTFYLWVNCGIVGLLNSKATGGFRIRFAGPTVTNFFEVYVGGNDAWPLAVAGGWVQFVVEIELARATAVANGWTGGTPPATSAIQHVGYAAITSIMTRTVDNTWIDSIWRLPANTAGIIVEGRNGGTTAWNFANIFTTLGQASGAFRPGPGGSYVLNTPLQIGINDTTTHSFADTNKLILWDTQEYISSGFYRLSALGNAGGTTSLVLGQKTGTGNDATGSQGCVFTQDPNQAGWTVDFDDANLNTIGLYGCTFQDTITIEFDSAAVESVSTQLLSAGVANISNSIQLRSTVVTDTGLGIGQASMVTDDLTDIRYCSFQGNPTTGHAIQITSATGSPFSFLGNTFTSYGPAARSFNTGTGVNTATDVITVDANHGYTTGWPVYYQDQGGVQTIGLTDGTLYWVRSIAANQLAFYTSSTNAIADTSRVNLTSGGTETHWIYSATAAIYNSSGSAITINVSDGGNTPTIRNSNGSSTTVNNAVTFAVSNIIPDSEVRIFTDDGNRTELAGIETLSGGVVSAILINGGIDYVAGDILTFANGTFTTAATIEITAVDGGGQITDFEILTPGSYSVPAPNPISESSSTSALGTQSEWQLNYRGSYSYSYNYTVDTPVIVVVFHLQYKDVWLTGQSLLNSDQNIPIQQITDRVFLNP